MIEYRPKFVFWPSFLAQLPLQLFFSFWAGGFVGGMLTALAPSVAKAISQTIGSPFLVIGLGVLVLFPVILLGLKRLNYLNTSYRLHADRIEVEEGFVTTHSKEIRISVIREVNLRRGIFQRLVGLGSVYVATQAAGQGLRWQTSSLLGGTSTFSSGIMLMDLRESEDAYRRILALVDGNAAVVG